MTVPTTVVFSTGPPIPATALAGTVIDRITGRVGVETRVEAVRRADSLVYATPTDSAGIFHIAHIPAGTYLLRAYRDANRNRALDSYEPRDSTQVEIGTENPGSVALSIVDPDTTAPRIASVTSPTTTRVELRFDDYLDPAQQLESAAVQIADTLGGGPVRVEAVGLTAPAVADSGANRPAARPQAPPAAPAAPAAAPAAGGAASRPSGALPSQTVYVRLAADTPLTPGRTYRVTVLGIRNVVGLVGESALTFAVPPARAAPSAPAAPPAPAPAVAAP